jgi:hypothetical protein
MIESVRRPNGLLVTRVPIQQRAAATTFTLYVNLRCLTTSPIPYGAKWFDVTFDFVDHVLLIETSNGGRERFALEGTR